MKTVRMLLATVCFIFVSYTAFGANYCLNCFDNIDENEKYCIVCKTKLSVDKLKNEEDQLIYAVTLSRQNYRKALDELREHYQSTGNQLRLQKARRELDALDKVPQPLYTNEGLGDVQTGTAFRDIEGANILLKDGLMYKKSLSKENRITAIKRLEKLLQEYPDSDKVDDAAFAIAEIYASIYFKDYESAAKYYIKSYQLNPDIKQPALLHAAEMYDKMADYNRAKVIYRQAAVYSPNAKSCKKAQKRLSILEQESYGKK
ncbi:MAG: hypothetical protein DWB56_13660 [Candidatus Jettenia sp.]|uniref:Uncharacterized protein n=1 Tax=Candidatus Jettenia caeni TaxID=247490 RepID=I3IQP3_9BACT|nr:hypothetical protein [Candidatus Jettenia sp. AMX1]MBC6929981.1 hypothetical protein [Candidatus Jettenia sp.]NUN23040.1 hypothetical protein [Candidatus Jettenia caeni]KAA0248467.1 MAG: hypothetical protein EDM77_12600 [Candidatus Jettenia sp. AMX1]MCE7881720.1 hypothetical protein [Candidatus Jettenia sp. AMX1]MCQ3928261.1 hypothetical protein [Candidatus Jettenia sp.]